jgi:hypothetical protein
MMRPHNTDYPSFVYSLTNIMHTVHYNNRFFHRNLKQISLVTGTFSLLSAFTFSLKRQSHEKVDELRVWGISLGPN